MVQDLVEDCVLNASREEAEEQELAWVREFHKSWSNVVFDASGPRLLVSEVSESSHSSNRLPFATRPSASNALALRRGLIRNLFVVIDFTSTMVRTDYKPSRIEYLIDQLCTVFLPRFFELNPLSSVALIALRDRHATFISRLTSQPKALIRRLANCALVPSGSACLQKALDLIAHSLVDTPAYASKEVLLLWGSLSTSELELERPLPCRLSVLSLEPELFALRKLADSTAGNFQVCMSAGHLNEHLLKFLTPVISASARPQYIKMGFPAKAVGGSSVNVSVKCACHLRPSAAYECPQCHASVCEIPADCPVCRLPLAHPDALAGVHRHLYVLPGFFQATRPVEQCFACAADVAAGSLGQCERCQHVFCRPCVEFILAKLLHCVGCSFGSQAAIPVKSRS
jgi:transcription initiation factor TFIIH subunit 2